MSTKLNVETFIAVLKKSGLVDRDRLEDALNDYSRSGTASEDPLPLVDRLIATNVLTKWQAEKLLQGKHRGYFLGKYKLLSLLGKGGMSSVYLAEHLLMRRRCALKVLPAKRVDDSSYLERFHREAQAVALLDHPNIVRAYDVDHQADGDRQIHFLVMEHVDGLSLQEMVAAKGVLPFLDAAEYTRQAAAGLQNAHENKMVHRDIKPGNLLVDQSGVVKILDLGLARFFATEEGDDALTIRHDEKVLGTADYLAPEQALDSHTVDARADIYSLGCTLYFMLSGQPPFTEGTLAQRLMAHQVKTPPPVESLRTDTPPGLVTILRKMMEKQASDRYPTAGEVEKAMFKWIDANADVQWRTAHSGVYGSRASHMETARKAIPVAQPIVAKVLTPVSNDRLGLQVAPSNSPNPDLSPSAMDTVEAAMDQFLATLSQSNADLKTPHKAASNPSIKIPPKAASNPSIKIPPKVASNPSIKALTKSSQDHVVPDLSALTEAKPADVTAPSEFPVFDPYEFRKSSADRLAETAKSNANMTALPRNSFSYSETLKSLMAAWTALPVATRGGIAAGAGLILLLMLYMLGGIGSYQTGAVDKPQPPIAFPNDKREVIVGGPKAEYANIRDALMAVRTRFRPRIGIPEKFVVRVAAGTYNEKIRIEGRGLHWPEGVVLRGDGDVILESSGDEPLIRLSNVNGLTIENIQVNAADKAVAIEVVDDLHETRLSKLVVRGFTDIGVLCKGAQGLPFGNNKFVLEQLTFEAASAQATGIHLEQGTDNDVSSILIKGCRFLGPMNAGIEVQSLDLFGIEISESIFNKVTVGIRVDGHPILKGIHVINNSFRQSKYGIRFAEMPNAQSTDLMFCRNLFTKIELAEAAIMNSYNENQFRSMFSSNPLGIENNFSDRVKPAATNLGEVQFIFDNGGRPGEQGFAFGSTDPNDSKFLAPTQQSPQRDVGGAQPFEKPWVGAIGP